MTVQTISVPLPLRRRDATDPAEAGSAVSAAAASDGACAHAGRCDRDACGQAERVTLRCPSLDTPTASPL